MLNKDLPGPFRNSKELILASKSPRRQRLLASLGLHFRVQPGKECETPPYPGQSPEDYCRKMARTKACSAYTGQGRGLILAADTIVISGQQILGKPENSELALQTLRSLNGTTHEVLTGCCLLEQASGLKKIFVVSTLVTMARHQDSILRAYVQTKEPLDKAGSYAIQGVGGFLVQSIQGSYTNVVGLPLNEVLQSLLDCQAIQLKEIP